MKVINSIVTQAASIAGIRRDIHAHPELCFEEVRTADVVAARLTEWGIPIHRGLGKTGVVGIIKGGDSPRAVALGSPVGIIGSGCWLASQCWPRLRFWRLRAL